MGPVAVILPAAGKSIRFGAGEKKPFVSLDGRPIWLRSLERFINRTDVAQCVLVLSPDDRETFQQRFGPNLLFLNVRLVDGGSERFESVANALAVLDEAIAYVAIHDAVRPNVTPALIDAVFAAARQHGAALPGVPVADTIKRADEQARVTATLSREGLWLAQTPQVFRKDWLLDAYARRHTVAGPITDDAQLVEACGHAVQLVPGDRMNFKLTTKLDLAFAEQWLKAQQASEKAAPRPAHPFADEEGW